MHETCPQCREAAYTVEIAKPFVDYIEVPEVNNTLPTVNLSAVMDQAFKILLKRESSNDGESLREIQVAATKIVEELPAFGNPETLVCCLRVFLIHRDDWS